MAGVQVAVDDGSLGCRCHGVGGFEGPGEEFWEVDESGQVVDLVGAGSDRLEVASRVFAEDGVVGKLVEGRLGEVERVEDVEELSELDGFGGAGLGLPVEGVGGLSGDEGVADELIGVVFGGLADVGDFGDGEREEIAESREDGDFALNEFTG